MPRIPCLPAILLCALGLALAGSALAADDLATMTKDAYRSSEDKIDAQHRADSKACDTLRAYDRDICEAQADGKEKVTRAELDARNRPGVEAAAKVKEVRADAAYDVAKERCKDLRGTHKGACRRDAKMVHERTRSQAKFEKSVARTAAKRATLKAAAAKPVKP